jgi:hypothetical protein
MIVLHCVCIVGWSYMLGKSFTWKQLEWSDRWMATGAFASLILVELNDALAAWKGE